MEVVQVMAGHHAGDMLDALLAPFGVPKVLPLFCKEGIEREIGFTQGAKLLQAQSRIALGVVASLGPGI
jgi:hypothetical protein